MANATSTVVLETRALVTADAVALEAGIAPSAIFQPAFIAETRLDAAGRTSMPTALDTAADGWRITFELASPMPGFVLYAYSFIGNLFTNSPNAPLLDTLFEKIAHYSISIAPDAASVEGWQEFTIGTGSSIDPIGATIMTLAPELKGLPIRARTPGGGVGRNPGG